MRDAENLRPDGPVGRADHWLNWLEHAAAVLGVAAALLAISQLPWDAQPGHNAGPAMTGVQHQAESRTDGLNLAFTTRNP